MSRALTVVNNVIKKEEIRNTYTVSQSSLHSHNNATVHILQCGLSDLIFTEHNCYYTNS